MMVQLETGNIGIGNTSTLATFNNDRFLIINVGVNMPDVGINQGDDVINGVIKFTEKEEIAVKAFIRDPRLSAARLADLIGLKQRQTQRIIASLKKKAGLKRRGAKKNGEWYFDGPTRP